MRARIARQLVIVTVLSGAVLIFVSLLPDLGWPGLGAGTLSGTPLQAAAAPAAAPAAAAPSPVVRSGPRAGVAGPPAPGLAVNAGRLPDQPQGDTPSQPREIPRRYSVDPTSVGRLKAEANQAAAAADRGAGPPPPPGPAPEFATVSYTGWNPPDAGLAVGPAHVLVAVNESFSIFNRSGTRLKGPTSLGGLFNSTDSTFDPRAVYDTAQSHFVVLATASSYVALAVSQTGDPTGLWCAYRLTVDPSGATWSDFPGLGMDGDNLHVTSNQFATADNSFQ